MKGFGKQNKSKKKKVIETKTIPSKEQIINQAIQFHLKGNILEASKWYQYCIHQGFENPSIFSNYGTILQDLGNLKEAELSYRKAIELNPDYAEAHFNLGNILQHLGQLQEAELSYCKAIELNSDLTKAYFSISTLKYSDDNKRFKDQIFSGNILKNKPHKNKIDIYFARANILHKEKNTKKVLNILG